MIQEINETETIETRWSTGSAVAYILTSVLLAAAVGLCLIISAQVSSRGYVDVFGYSIFRVVTGSMEPSISVGEAIISRKTPAQELQPGDVICYRTYVAEIRGSIVTHRIVSVQTTNDGVLAFETRGDANLTSDPYLVPADQIIGRVVWTSGSETFFTDLLSFVTGKIGFLACVVFPVTLAAGLILQKSVGDLKKEISAVRRKLDEEDERMPGFSTLTKRDYEEIYETIRNELLKELEHEATTESEKTE